MLALGNREWQLDLQQVGGCLQESLGDHIRLDVFLVLRNLV